MTVVYIIGLISSMYAIFNATAETPIWALVSAVITFIFALIGLIVEEVLTLNRNKAQKEVINTLKQENQVLTDRITYLETVNTVITDIAKN